MSIRFCFRALRAVTVELIGVLAAVWMLFGFAAFGMSGTTRQPPTFNPEIEQAMSNWQTSITSRFLPPAAPPHLDETRERYVADRLAHFSQRVLGSSRH